jgi:diguanylate cyclase (GGDEF)-like protein
MISLKKYLDSASVKPEPQGISGNYRETDREKDKSLLLAMAAYRSALREMGSCSVEACPGLGQGLKKGLGKLEEKLATDTRPESISFSEANARKQLQDWGRDTSAHYRQKTAEVKDLLIVMARTAESVAERDQRCSGQISEVTARLRTIASLEDLTQIRSSIEKSAADLKTSLDRMDAEGKQAIAKLRAEVSTYQVKLEEAEELASRDALTGLHNRFWAEGQIELRVARGGPLSVAIIDIDDFKRVNDEHGHLVGDELLQQFATELKSASRSSDLIGRWGGDEFILVLDCRLDDAEAQIERLKAWVCGTYAVQSRSGPMKLKMDASIGLAEHVSGEPLKELLTRADNDMYAHKAAARDAGGATKR